MTGGVWCTKTTTGVAHYFPDEGRNSFCGLEIGLESEWPLSFDEDRRCRKCEESRGRRSGGAYLEAVTRPVVLNAEDSAKIAKLLGRDRT